MTNLKSAAATYAAITALFLASGVAVAQTSAETDQVRTVVHYADLNLGSVAGQAALKARIERAAKRICKQAGALPIYQLRQQARCRKDALASAEPQIAQAITRASTFAQLSVQRPQDK